MVRFRLGFAVAAVCILLHAQAAPELRFEVASVKATPQDRIGNTSISPYGTGRFSATNVTLELLIELAFGMRDDQIQGAPGWLASERYDVQAKAPDGVSLTYDQLHAPLQALLIQRFKLATHLGSKEVSGYALVLSKGGVTLKPGKPDKSQPMILPNGVQAASISMAMLAGMLTRVAGRPVVDKTGLSGNYNVKLRYAPANDPNSSLPSVFTALQEQAGLKLEPAKVPYDVVIIDHVERVPIQD
jgi:uncharacterized protein (TIGR03435 family)